MAWLAAQFYIYSDSIISITITSGSFKTKTNSTSGGKYGVCKTTVYLDPFFIKCQVVFSPKNENLQTIAQLVQTLRLQRILNKNAAVVQSDLHRPSRTLGSANIKICVKHI